MEGRRGRGGKEEKRGKRRKGESERRKHDSFALTDWADFLENTKGSFIKHWANKKVETS